MLMGSFSLDTELRRRLEEELLEPLRGRGGPALGDGVRRLELCAGRGMEFESRVGSRRWDMDLGRDLAGGCARRVGLGETGNESFGLIEV